MESFATLKRRAPDDDEEVAAILPPKRRWLEHYMMEEEGEQQQPQDATLEEEEEMRETPLPSRKRPLSEEVEVVVPVKKHAMDSTRMCDVCNIPITKSNWARHIKTASHQQKLKAPPPSDVSQSEPVVPLIRKIPNLLPIRKQMPKLLPIRKQIPKLLPISKRPPKPLSISSKPVKHLPLTIELEKTGLRKTFRNYTIWNRSGYKNLQHFLEDCSPLICETLSALESSIKFQLLVEADYTRGIDPHIEIQTMNFKTKNITLFQDGGSTVAEYYNNASGKLLRESEEFTAKGSNWSMVRIKRMLLHTSDYKPLRGSSYIQLPQKIIEKRAVVNVQNEDQKCFLWAVLSALHPVEKNCERLYNYDQYKDEFNDALHDVEFPMTLDKIKVFEDRTGVSINVYAYDEKYNIYPLRITKKDQNRHVDLLYVKNSKSNHFCWIKNISRLVSSQLSRNEHKVSLCKRCLQHFNSSEALETHTADCKNHDPIVPGLPKGENCTLSFKDHHKTMTVPFVCYADFESCLTTAEDENRYQKHVPVSFCYYIVREGGAHYKDPVTYFGPDAAQQFVRMLKEEAININRIYKNIIQMKPLSPAQELEHQSATLCHICKGELNHDKVYDHDHLSGLYRGPAHNTCNLKYKTPNFLPVFIHNLSGYDSHLFVKSFGADRETIDVIPNNEERYVSFTVHVQDGLKLRFLDSFRFVNRSLDSLAKNLSKDQFTHTGKFYSDNHIDLVLRKGVYPYDYMSDLEKYKEKSLPPIEEFYNLLNETNITEEDYQHAKRVWDAFHITDMEAYTTFYNKTDVLLLADVMENFRSVCKKTYELDPAWFFTAPGLAWSALLKISGVRLSLLTDYDQILMVEKSIRGGVSQCSHRYGESNNRYMDNYDASQDSRYLMYFDANNLYGWAMSQCMPYDDFRWVDTNIDVTDVPDDSDTGYIMEVDLEYPHSLHNAHSDLPLAPEHMCPPGSKQVKLLTTLFDKQKYVLHYRNLKFYLSQGMRLTKVHRVLAFKQKPWMRSYIDLNTNMRTMATNDFEKDFYKLMNNAVFGKTMENIRKRAEIKLVTDPKKAQKLISKPFFKSRTIFTEDLTAVHMRKKRLQFDKPVYVGASVLDVSKTLMYQFHYNVMKRAYGDNIVLMYTDTDSLIYKITTEDVYKDMARNIQHFDTSDYPADNVYGLPRVNRKVLGKMKDEMNGRLLRRFVGLRSKMYSLETDTTTVKKSKGVKRSVVEADLRFEHYLECLHERRQRYTTMNQIRSFHHDVHTIECWKLALSPFDDKRCVLSDGISTLPWGHHQLEEKQE